MNCTYRNLMWGPRLTGSIRASVHFIQYGMLSRYTFSHLTNPRNRDYIRTVYLILRSGGTRVRWHRERVRVLLWLVTAERTTSRLGV